jgi:monofunctional biosynthetic peptidoglycan transglycosylase
MDATMPMKRKILLGLAAAVGLWWSCALSSTIATPHVTYLQWFPPWKTAFMEQDHNDDIAYRWVPRSRISKLLQQAVILAEDDQFFEHQGFDLDAMKKAARINWKKKTYKRGASTITMQLARNLCLSPTKTLLRKFREFLIALKLERELSKTRILELYLNVAEWGDGIYGAEAAAQHYFRKNASDLNRHEAAFLAVILPRPRFYDRHRNGPYLSRRVATIESRL